MRNSNKHQAVANILENLSDPDTKWAVPVPGLGIIFGLTPNCEHSTTTEFVALDGKVVFRADQPRNMVKMHGRLWGLADDSSFKPGTNKLLLGAAVCPRGGRGASVLRLRVSQGVRIPVGYLTEEEVGHDILRTFGIKTLLSFPVQAKATPTPPSNKRPAFIVKEVPEPVRMVPVPEKPEFKPIFIPGYFGKFHQMRSRRRNSGPAAPRKPLNEKPPVPASALGRLAASMTKFPRHWEETESTPRSSLPGVFGITVG